MGSVRSKIVGVAVQGGKIEFTEIRWLANTAAPTGDEPMPWIDTTALRHRPQSIANHRLHHRRTTNGIMFVNIADRWCSLLAIDCTWWPVNWRNWNSWWPRVRRIAQHSIDWLRACYHHMQFGAVATAISQRTAQYCPQDGETAIRFPRQHWQTFCFNHYRQQFAKQWKCLWTFWIHRRERK